MTLSGGGPGKNVSSGLRTAVYVGAVLLGFAIVLARVYSLQITQGAEFAKRSLENFIQTKRLQHDRGEIVDRKGRVLVTNRPAYNVTITPVFLPRTERTLAAIGRAVGLSQEEALAAAVALRRSAEEDGPPTLLARDLGAAAVRALRAAQARLEVPLDAVPVIETLGDDEPSYAAYMDPATFPSVARVFRRLRAILRLSKKEIGAIEKRVRGSQGLSRYKDVVVRSDVKRAVAERLTLEVELGDLPGVSVREGRARTYRDGQTAAHLLGYVNELSPQELEARRDLGYRLGDNIGRRGVERAFEEALRGLDGEEPVVVDSKGRAQISGFARDLRSVGERVQPRPGNRVTLTIDLDIQRAAESAFPGAAGSVVVMDVHTGRLLAITSTPTFDPNLVSGVFDPKEKARLDGMQALRPWRFRPIQDHYAPGSTFKVATAWAALADKSVSLTEKIRCNGAFKLGRTRFRCWRAGGHGGVDLVNSLKKSCDVFYYTLGHRVGLDPIADAARKLGLGGRTGIPLAGESPGIMPTARWYDENLPEGYTGGAAVNASIGQGAVAITPLQLVVAYATIANGGTVWRPQIALKIESVDGTAVRHFDPVVVRKLAFEEAHLTAIRAGLHGVVNEPGGTAYWRRLRTLPVAGKTGTAQVAKLGALRLKASEYPFHLRDHAWFAAYAPSEDPQIAVVVLNEHGGHGGSGAAPTAMAVVKAWDELRRAQAGLQGSTPGLGVRYAASGDEPWSGSD